MRTEPDPRPAPDLALGRLCLGRALAQRCPQCGRGHLFLRWSRLRERCEVCGLIYRRESGAELGAMIISTVINTGLAGAVFLLIWSLTDWDAWVSFGVCAPLMLGVSYALAPLAMSLWTGIDYLTDVANDDWWARPRR